MGDSNAKRSIVYAKITGRDSAERNAQTGTSKAGCSGWVQRSVRQPDRSDGEGPEHQGDGQRGTPCERQGAPQVSGPLHEILLTQDQWLNLVAQLPKQYDNIDWGVTPVIGQAITYYRVAVGTYFSILGILDASVERPRG